jgi:hypothetical protein
MPADRAAALPQAFARTIKNPDFIAQSDERSLDVDPLAADEIGRLAAEDMAMPAGLVEAMRGSVVPEK